MYKLNNNINKDKIGVSHNLTVFIIKIVINKFFWFNYIFSLIISFYFKKLKLVKCLKIKFFKIKKY